ncbi:TolC family protein [Lujinxingia litoralis]|nr:TolC family protein [Lujinxingia litoralis]
MALLGVLALPQSASAQSEVSVDEVVRAALARPDIEERFSARIAGARAEVDEELVIPMPTLELAHEQVFGNADVRNLEFSALVEQSFDLSGWRASLREAWPHRESALRAAAQSWRLEVATTVREAFFRVRHHQERMAVMDAWIAGLERGLTGVQAREARGDVSAYQTRRIRREIELATARRASEAAVLAEAWANLERWTTWETRPRLRGDLQPTAAPSAEIGELRRPKLERLQHQKRALRAELDAWGSPFLRGWALGAGYRYVDAGSSDGHGFLVTLALPLAFWNTDAPRREQLRAQHLEASRELALLTSLATREHAAAQARLEAALRSLEAMSDPAHDGELTRLAQVAFEAGEATLPELLDAFESDADLQLARLDLQWEARRAAIALDRSRSLGVPQ